MKNFKKIASAIAALSLAACVAVPMSATVFTASAEASVTTGTLASTDKTSSLTIEDNTTGYTYVGYQIFVGDLAYTTTTGSEDTSKDGTEYGALSNVQWGANIDDTKTVPEDGGKTIYAALAEITVDGGTKPFDGADTAAKVAAALGDASGDADVAAKFADVVADYLKDTAITFKEQKADGATTGYKAENLAPGYYLVMNESVPTESGSYTKYVMKVAGEVSAEPKRGVPTFDKKIKDVNESGNEGTEHQNGTWKDSADHDVNDLVDFQLKATLPSNYDAYKSYALTFHDSFHDVSGVDVFTYSEADAAMQVYIDTNNNGKYDDGEDTLLAKENNYTVSTSPTGHSDDSYDCDLEITIENLKDKLATLPEGGANVIVEYKAKLNNKAVIGSKGNWNGAYLEYSNNPNYTGDGDSSEEDKKGKTPEEVVVTFTYQLDVNKVEPDGADKTKPLKGAGFTLYKWNGTDWDTGTVITAGADESSFTISGIDAGKYKLEESTVPSGYNKAEDVIFFVEATHTDADSKSALTELTVYGAKADGSKDDNNVLGSSNSGKLVSGKTYSFTANVTKDNADDGHIKTDILNQKGATLPSTGGIGTTLFYLGGGALVAVAGVMLITKKRMTKE